MGNLMGLDSLFIDIQKLINKTQYGSKMLNSKGNTYYNMNT